MRYRPKKIQYPIYREEFRIVTPSGVVSRIFEDEKLARERFKTAPLGWKLVRMTIMQEVLLSKPSCHRELHQPAKLTLVA